MYRLAGTTADGPQWGPSRRGERRLPAGDDSVAGGRRSGLGLAVRADAGEDADAEDRQDHAQADQRRHVVPVRDDHLEADPAEHDRQRGLQVDEALERRGDCEVERSQAEQDAA